MKSLLHYGRTLATVGTLALSLVGATLSQVPAQAATNSSTPTAPSAVTCNTYHVVKGDTLSKIARRFHTTIKKLKADNHIANINLIKVGQKLMVCSGKSK